MSEPADLVLRGEVYPVEPDTPRAEALAVRGGRIVAVGSASEVDEVAGPRTRTLDLAGHLILPGFQDSHVHPPHAGLERMRCDLNDASGPRDYASRIRAYAGATPYAILFAAPLATRPRTCNERS